MRTLLLKASPADQLRKGFRSTLVGQPIGLLQIAACIRQARPGDEVRIVDASVQMERASDLGSLLEEYRPEVLGLSGLSLDEPVVREMASTARRWSRDLFIICGGPIATARPRRVLALPGIDLVCIGEGEVTLPELLDARERGEDPRSVRGVAHLDEDGKVRQSPSREFVPDLEDLPPMDYSDLDIDLYTRVNNFSDLPPMADRYVSILTSRGCPYRCTFCHGMMGRKVRAWSVPRVVDEMERLTQEQDVGEFHIVDDIFNHRRSRIGELCSEIRERRLDIRLAFPNGLRGDRIGPGDMEDLASVGCVSMSLAVESVSPRILEMIRKDIDLDSVFQAAREAREAGIFTRGYIMLGFPTETREEMELTIRLMRESAFDTVYAQPVIPYPGTPVFDLAVENGFEPDEHFGYAYDYRQGGDINASPLSDEEFRQLLLRATDEIYSEPERMKSLRAFWSQHPRPDHPLFTTQGQWKTIVDGWRG